MVGGGINSICEIVMKHSWRPSEKQKFISSSCFLFSSALGALEIVIFFRTRKPGRIRIIGSCVSIFDNKCGSYTNVVFPVQLTKGLWIKNLCAFPCVVVCLEASSETFAEALRRRAAFVGHVTSASWEIFRLWFSPPLVTLKLQIVSLKAFTDEP